jgi:hypothetical protein
MRSPRREYPPILPPAGVGLAVDGRPFTPFSADERVGFPSQPDVEREHDGQGTRRSRRSSSQGGNRLTLAPAHVSSRATGVAADQDVARSGGGRMKARKKSGNVGHSGPSDEPEPLPDEQGSDDGEPPDSSDRSHPVHLTSPMSGFPAPRLRRSPPVRSSPGRPTRGMRAAQGSCRVRMH